MRFPFGSFRVDLDWTSVRSFAHNLLLPLAWSWVAVWTPPLVTVLESPPPGAEEPLLLLLLLLLLECLF